MEAFLNYHEKKKLKLGPNIWLQCDLTILLQPQIDFKQNTFFSLFFSPATCHARNLACLILSLGSCLTLYFCVTYFFWGSRFVRPNTLLQLDAVLFSILSLLHIILDFSPAGVCTKCLFILSLFPQIIPPKGNCSLLVFTLPAPFHTTKIAQTLQNFFPPSVRKGTL